jgi:hypothetical protein
MFSNLLLAPAAHEQFLITRDRFFLELWTGMLALHDCSYPFFSALSFQVSSAEREETCELTQIVTSDSLHDVRVLVVHAVFR